MTFPTLLPFTLEINNFLPKAGWPFTRSNLFTLCSEITVTLWCPWQWWRQQTHIQVADGSVTQPRFGSDKKTRGKLRQEKEENGLHGAHESEMG